MVYEVDLFLNNYQIGIYKAYKTARIHSVTFKRDASSVSIWTAIGNGCVKCAKWYDEGVSSSRFSFMNVNMSGDFDLSTRLDLFGIPIVHAYPH
jgi:hypothetical protein